MHTTKVPLLIFYSNYITNFTKETEKELLRLNKFLEEQKAKTTMAKEGAKATEA